MINADEFNRIADEIYSDMGTKYTKAITDLKKATGCDLKTANEAIISRMEKDPSKPKKPSTMGCLWELIKLPFVILKILFGGSHHDKTPRCPNCGCTEFGKYSKDFDYDRGMIGYEMDGVPGALFAGLSGAETHLICLNCGSSWRIK